jgi:tellurite resistance protein
MTEWATINIQLLLLDHCSEILQKAITILDGVSSYHAEMIGNLNWSSTSPFCTTLLLIKLYLQGNFGNAEAIVEHLELPIEDILTLAAKIITNDNSDNTAANLLQETNLSDIQIENKNQKYYISETLTQFNQIMWTTTVDLWKHNKLIMVQTTAASNLKAKITALETVKATAATAAAIARATEKLQDIESRTMPENLRITNLEKGFKRQEQKTNELLNTLNNKNKNKNSKQKNFQGSQAKEPMASPRRTVLPSPHQRRTSD